MTTSRFEEPVVVFPLTRKYTAYDSGLIPTFLDLNDERPAAEQFDEKYIGGWRPQHGFKMNEYYELLYPGDPTMPPLALILFRGENVFIYQYGYVASVQKDKSFEVCRMD